MLATAYPKNPSSRYFRLRSGMSSQRGAWTFRPKISRPPSQSHSDSVPIGHSQLQNAFRATNEMTTKAASRNIAAGWTSGTEPVSRAYFRFIRPAIGSQPSTPGGRPTNAVCPPVS